jgi:hypothetical protein
MKKSILAILTIIILVSGLILAQKENSKTISQRWEKVNELADKQLPESALKEVETILAQAQKEKNPAQVIKAMIYKMRFTLDKDPDKAPVLIKEFEAFTEKSNDPTERALLHSMTAELYALYYQKDQWTINQRTELKDLVPEDMKEWTKNIYFDKVSQHLAASLENATVLQKTDALKYNALLEKGNDSRNLQPTLFDLLGERRITVLQKIDQTTAIKNPLSEAIYYADASEFIQQKQDTAYAKSIENQIIDTYCQLLKFRTEANNTAALINLDLERLEYIRSNNENTDLDSLYLRALDRLEKYYSNNESVIEVLAEKASYYYDKTERFNYFEYRRGAPKENSTFKRKAYDICADGIKRFPNYKRIGLLENIQKKITAKNIVIHYKKSAKPSSNLKIEIQSSNTSNLTLNIYKVNATALEYQTYKQKRQYDKELYFNKTLVDTRSITVKPDENFGTVSSETEIKTGDYGIYEFTIEETGNKTASNRTKGEFTVTDLGFMARSNTAKLENLFALDRQSGQPLPNVLVKVYMQKWNGGGYSTELRTQIKTDNSGMCQYPFDSNYYQNILYFERGKDKYFTSETEPRFYDSNRTENETVKLNLFTDRSLYRPGQTVYFKGISYFSTKKSQRVVANSTFEVTLFDANNQKLTSKKLTTNDFGSFAGEFALPMGGLNGAYRLQVKDFSTNIWVEEYKRPTFEVLMPKPTNEIQFGDKIVMTGTVKAYAGYNIADAVVKYRVVRRTHHYCWWWNEPELEVSNGTTKSNVNGSFELSFIADKNKIDGGSGATDRAYSYTVYTDVTDPKGETQQGEQTVSVGDKSLFIIADIPAQINKKDKVSLEISTETINDEKVSSTVKYLLYRLKESAEYAENLNDNISFKVAEQVMSGSFETKNKKLDLALQSFQSGRYKMVLNTTDAHGKQVEIEKIFVLFGNDDNCPPVKSYIWLQTPKTICAVNEIAKIKFGTSTKNTAVLYEIMQGNRVLESHWLPFSDEIKTFEIPFEESYGPGVTVLFTFMKDEQFFTRSVQITQKVTEKKLTPTLSVFRNKLQPGEKAEWTVTIPESAKTKTAAELLIGMYDASLDKIRPHSWNFNPTYREWLSYSPTWNPNNFETGADNVSYELKMSTVYQYQFDQLNWFGLDLNGYFYGRPPVLRSSVKFSSPPAIKRGKGIISVADVKGSDDVNGRDIADVKADITESPSELREVAISSAMQKKVAGIEVASTKLKPVQIRTNFNETAFFYPQLQTDENGSIKFTFTAPESLTRWNVKMLAHTKDLYFGQGEAQVLTQKDLMLQMNLPRFVRRSDKLVLSANVINLTDKVQTTTVQFELSDPATDKPIKIKDAAQKTITLAANETKAVEWELTEFSPFELVICKVVARAGNFSDGEQKYLPVLPDKVLITESMPLTLRGNQTRQFNFESLIKNAATVSTKNLSVEFSSNPAWYAVQALPTIAEPENDNAIDLFTAYYANSLATFIANSNPKLATMFDSWKKAGGSREALLSNLEKNSELKNMLLEETPWVMAAKNETEQKRQIALLFDLNNQKNKNQQYMNKLLQLQLPSGAFSWFKGMGASRYVTQEILLNMGRLNRMTGQLSVNSYQSAVKSALNYLDYEIANDFIELKKYNKNYQKENCIGNMQLFYLHLRSEYPTIPIAATAQEAVKFYSAQSEKYWTGFTLYGKAMMAIVAKRNGKVELAADILKSLKENALKTDELGMYWAKNTPGYFWNERPIGVQAAIIEAFTEISKNTADIDELKIWLLKQKQTQRWDSPMSTVDAIYALLNNGSDWLANEGSVEIKVGNTTLKPESTEAGTGYFKQTLATENIGTETGKITVKKNDSGIGWGAMYWQFYQDLDKVTGQSGALKVSKKLFVEKMSTSGKSLLPIEQTILKKGDKVITRLVVTTDRNLDFVALKDLRAACFEPVNQQSGCEWKEGVCYYQTTKDASTQFFFSFLPKGTYVFEYELWANNSGDFTSGIASIQCQYAPEFISHTGGEHIKIAK